MRLLSSSLHPDINTGEIIPGRRAVMPSTIMGRSHLARAALYGVTEKMQPGKVLATVAVAGNDDDRANFPDFADRYVFNDDAGLKIVRNSDFPVMIDGQRRNFLISVTGPAGIKSRETFSPHDRTDLKLNVSVDYPKTHAAPTEFDMTRLTGSAREEAFDNLVKLLRGGQIFTEPVATGAFGHLWAVDENSTAVDGVYVLLNPIGVTPDFRIDHLKILRGKLLPNRRIEWREIPDIDKETSLLALSASRRQEAGAHSSEIMLNFDILSNDRFTEESLSLDEHGNVTSGLPKDAQVVRHLGDALYWGLEKYFR